MASSPAPPPQQPRPQGRAARPWYQDAVSAVAFLALALLATKMVSRAVGPFGGLFFLLLTGGAGWFFLKAAWRGVTNDRQQGD